MPQAIDMEEAVLGALLLESRNHDNIFPLLFPDVFYKEEHQRIFNAIHQLYKDGKQIDILTITERLRSTGELELVGGAYYISLLTIRVASSIHTESHVRILLQKYFKRFLFRMGSEMTGNSCDDTIDVFDQIDQHERDFNKIHEIKAMGGNFQHIGKILPKCESGAKRRELMAKSGQLSGITTGLMDLNKITQGWQPSDLIILASRPSMGKTAMMLFFAKQAAMDGHPVCIYSIEMSDISLVDRLILSDSDIPIEKYKSGYMSDLDWKWFNKAKDHLSKLPIYIEDNPSVSMNYIRSHSKVKRKQGLCSIIFIDYLQLVDVNTNEYNRSREQEIAQATRQAKIISKELDVPIILLCQLNRDVEKRQDKKPMLSDLRESGAIEQDADIVMLLYRPAKYGLTEDVSGNNLKNFGELIIAKNRNGSTTRDVPFNHNEEMTKIYDYDPEK